MAGLGCVSAEPHDFHLVGSIFVSFLTSLDLWNLRGVTLRGRVGVKTSFARGMVTLCGCVYVTVRWSLTVPLSGLFTPSLSSQIRADFSVWKRERTVKICSVSDIDLYHTRRYCYNHGLEFSFEGTVHRPEIAACPELRLSVESASWYYNINSIHGNEVEGITSWQQ